MTLRVRALSEEEADKLARMTRSHKLGAGLVGRARTGPVPIRRPSQPPEKTGSYRENRCITSPSTCSRGSRAIIHMGMFEVKGEV